jgi:hypothetical protein
MVLESFPKSAIQNVVNERDIMQETLLLNACKMGCWHLIPILLKNGSNIFAKDKKGNNCLHLSLKSNPFSVGCIAALLPFCCGDILEEKDAEGNTAMALALQSEKYFEAKLLFAAGACPEVIAVQITPDHILKYERERIQSAAFRSPFAFEEDGFQEEPLQKVERMQFQDFSLSEKLSDAVQGFAPFPWIKKTKFQQNDWEKALQMAVILDRDDVFQYLLTRLGKPFIIAWRNVQGDTLLHEAVRSISLHVIPLLSKPLLEVSNDQKQTPFDMTFHRRGYGPGSKAYHMSQVIKNCLQKCSL